MKFQPGESGNPTGPAPGLGSAKTLAKSLSVDAVQVLASIQADPSAAQAVRVDAAKNILAAAGLPVAPSNTNHAA